MGREEGMGLEDIVGGVAIIKIHCLKLEEAQLRQSIGGARIAKHAIFFRGRKGCLSTRKTGADIV